MLTEAPKKGNTEPMVGVEPTTYSLPWSCSAAELHRRSIKITGFRNIFQAPHPGEVLLSTNQDRAT